MHFLRAMETKIMSAFTDLLADNDTLIAEVQEMVDRLAQVPAEIATAVQAALDAAGVDPSITSQAIADADAKAKAAIAQVTQALGAQAPAAPVVPTQVPTTADTGPVPAPPEAVVDPAPPATEDSAPGEDEPSVVTATPTEGPS